MDAYGSYDGGLGEQQPSAPYDMDGMDDFSRLVGDYYVEEENVMRGVTFFGSELMDGSSPFDTSAGKLKNDDTLDDPFADCGFPQPPPLAPHALPRAIVANVVLETDFASMSHPPKVPFGGFAATSVNLGNVHPVDVMRAICTFFETEMSGAITKFSPHKCAVKADVFREEDSCAAGCTVKARLFQDETQQLVAEFQRREGDALAFGSVFKRMEDYLRVYFTGEAQTRAPQDLQIIPAALALTAECEDLQPLVDTVLSATSPETQAEALAALLVLTNVAAAALKVRMVCERLRDTFEELAMSPVLSVALPATRLASWHCS
jgi:hypothetical protein